MIFPARMDQSPLAGAEGGLFNVNFRSEELSPIRPIAPTG